MHKIADLIKNPDLFETVSESDIDDLSEQLYPILEEKIHTTADFLSRKIMASPGNESRKAFEYKIKDAIKKSVYSYVAHKKWKSNVEISPYVSKSLSIFSKVFIDEDNVNNNLVKVLVCPACKERHIKEFLKRNDNTLFCGNCVAELENKTLLPWQAALCKIFSSHSVDGVRCSKCNRFVPNSVKIDNVFLCPYPGCGADCSNAEEMRHPAAAVARTFVSMNNNMNGKTNDFSAHKPKEFIEQYCDGNENACDALASNEDFKHKYKTISDVIEQQKKAHAYTRKLPNKAAMYDAFQIILEKYPDDMVKYITVGGQGSDISIQATIFQEFAKILQTKLPIKMYANGDEIYIDKPTDPRLHLFTGIREFSNFIDQNSTVRKRKGSMLSNDELIDDNDDSFIGHIIYAQTIDGIDVTDLIDYYTFSNIRFKYNELVKPGNDILVRYYSIIPNYTMGSMIHLQRIKKRIRDSVIKKGA